MSPRYGGPVTVVKALAEYQARDKHHVEVCTTNCDYPSGLLREPGTEIDADERLTYRYFPVEMGSIKFSRQMRAFLKKNVRRFDLLHVHGLNRFPPTYAAYRARQDGTPYMIRPFGSLAPHLRDFSANSLFVKRIYERLFDGPNIRAADCIQYTTHEEYLQSSLVFPDVRACVIPNGIDWRKFEVLPARGSFRKEYGLQDEPVVLFVGRIHPVKGIDLLVSALSEIRRRIASVKLMVVGPENDNYGDKLRTVIAQMGLREHVVFVGHLDSAALVQAYVDSDVFVLPSKGENFGMSVVEAMACGVPVVISESVAIGSDVRASGAGIVLGRHVNAFAAEIIDLLGDAGKRRVMGDAGRRWSQQAYSWSNVARQVSQQYEEICGVHRRG